MNFVGSSFLIPKFEHFKTLFLMQKLPLSEANLECFKISRNLLDRNVFFNYVYEKDSKGTIMTIKIKRTENKKKVGTILDKEIVKKVKERSAKEGRTISDIIQDALIKYNEVDVTKSEIRKAAVTRFCSRPFNIKINDINKLLDMDYYEQ